jgi:hypothetical protein
MTDNATREPGWYVIYDEAGAFLSLCWLHDGWWDGGNALPELPAGWTVGPSLADVLRDAERYRWLRDDGMSYRTARIVALWFSGDDLSEALTAKQMDVAIDAEIARERDG